MDSLSTSLNPNKRLKEEFVSNLTGSSMLEISALATLVPVLILLRHSIGSDRIVDTTTAESKLKKDNNAIIGSSWWDYMASLLVDFLLIMLPILLFLTVLAAWMYQAVVFMTLLLLLVLSQRGPVLVLLLWMEGPSLLGQIFPRTEFLCLSILAVDFTIFPRRYAKTETFGTGLMDIGVGSFVLANSLVSRQARNISSMKLKTAVQSTSPLIILGFSRLLSTKGSCRRIWCTLEFLFTLAAMSILTSIIDVPSQYCGILGSVILVVYQSCLMRGLNTYLLSEERGTDLISQNKEGLFSIFGYWGIYLVGVQLGNCLVFQNQASVVRSNKWARTRVWLLSVLFWVLTVLIDAHVERVSRRMCNLAYATMVLAVNLQVLGILMLSDFIPGSKTSVLEQACNRNLLATFLLANVLTGLVNLSMDTLSASPITALSILIAYAFTTCVVIGLVDFYGIRLKFW